MCVYSPEHEEAELQGAVLGVVAADQLLLALRQVERQTVALGEDGRDEQHARPDGWKKMFQPCSYW